MSRRTGLAALLVAAFAAAVAAAPATAAPTTTGPTFAQSLIIRRVDTTAYPKVKLDAQVVGAAADPSSFTVQNNGSRVSGVSTVPLANSGQPVGTALVLDTSATMNNGDKLAQTKLAAKQYIAQKTPNEVIALVATGSVPRVVTDFTPDAAQLNAAIDALPGQGELALYNGLILASGLFDKRPDLLANMVVIVDRADTLSKISVTNTRAALTGVKAAVFTLGLAGESDLDPSVLRSLSVGGGQYTAVGAAATLPSAVGAVQKALQSAYELSFSGPPSATSLDLVVSTRALHAEAHTVPGGVANGSDAVATPVKTAQAPPLFRGQLGVLLIALLALAAVGLFTYAVLALMTAQRSNLETALMPYDEGGMQPEPDTEGSMVQTALVARAVEMTGRLAEERGVLERVESMLEQADLSVRPAEALFFYLAGVIIVTLVAVVRAGPILGFVVLVIVGLAPPALLSFLAGRRLRRFTAQLPDTLQLLASSLRAGFSFLQGVEAVSRESAKPMGDELRRVMIEARLGRPIEEALQDCADRMQSPDFDWAVMAVRIQREVGGNLAELLQTVGETMIERERLRRDVKSLTAEGRVSAIVLGVMPPALGAIFYVTNPTYMKVLFTHLGGQIALAVATVMMVVGFFWMKKVVDVEV